MASNFKIAVNLSGLIYEDWPNVKSGLQSMGMDMVCEPFDIEGSQGMLILGQGGAYLVFRGTEASKAKLRDILSNFGWPREWAGQGKALSGYATHFSYIRDPARSFAERIPTPIPLYVIGHSLGGVLATLYASWVASGNPTDHKLAGLITFGAPKVLDDEGLQSISCPIFRFTNRYDFAPYWPPVPGLAHPKNQVKINSGGWPGPVSRHHVDKYIRMVP